MMQKQAPEMEALELLAVRVDMLVTEARATIGKAIAENPASDYRASLRSVEEILDRISAATLEAYEQAANVRDSRADDARA